MVSDRCKMVVKEELRKLGLHFIYVGFGEVDLMEAIKPDQKKKLKIALLSSGFELVDGKKAVLVGKIKNIVIEMIHHTDIPIKMNFSVILSEKLYYDYTYLATMFMEIQGVTIEHFIIEHKIERIKELIIYDELNISEIALKMNYCSTSALSNQFKKITGLTPSHFKKLKGNKRYSLEDIGN
jgi:hypothetical protein